MHQSTVDLCETVACLFFVVLTPLETEIVLLKSPEIISLD